MGPGAAWALAPPPLPELTPEVFPKLFQSRYICLCGGHPFDMESRAALCTEPGAAAWASAATLVASNAARVAACALFTLEHSLLLPSDAFRDRASKVSGGVLKSTLQPLALGCVEGGPPRLLDLESFPSLLCAPLWSHSSNPASALTPSLATEATACATLDVLALAAHGR